MFRKFTPERCYIVAEIGGNFTTYEQATRLIDAAAVCGVDAIKLQTYRAETLSSRKAMFDMENTGVTSQFDLFKQYEIDEALHRAVFTYAEQAGLDWFSSPSHQNDVDMLERCGVGAHKIGSDDAINLPFLRYVARTGKPVILSTGMSTLDEVKESVEAILAEGNDQLILLHAITSYPTHPSSAAPQSRILKPMRYSTGEISRELGHSDPSPHGLDPLARQGAASNSGAPAAGACGGPLEALATSSNSGGGHHCFASGRSDCGVVC